MKRKLWIGTAIFCVSAGSLVQAAQSQSKMQQSPAKPMSTDCSTMSPEMQQFAAGLSGTNRMMFCGSFSDAQRNQAMQLSTQMDATGNMMMTPDQAVETVGSSMNQNQMQQKPPAGCPVK